MCNTKEDILLAALRLFAVDGYEAVSVSQIAGALGMTKGALYKHYQNKRDIFDHILARMERMDREQARNFLLPEELPEENEQAYARCSLDQLVAFSREQFLYWTTDDFAASFRKMLTLEQFRNGEMQALYQQYLGAGPMDYVARILRFHGVSEPRERAAAFYGAMFLYFSLYDGGQEKDAVIKALTETLSGLAKKLFYERKDNDDRRE